MKKLNLKKINTSNGTMILLASFSENEIHFLSPSKICSNVPKKLKKSIGLSNGFASGFLKLAIKLV